MLQFWRKQLCTTLPAIVEYNTFNYLHKIFMVTELQVFDFVQVTVNAPLVQVSLIWITHSRTHTLTRISVNNNNNNNNERMSIIVT